MTHYRITSLLSGADLGVYEAETGEQAIKAMITDAGYPYEAPDESLRAEPVTADDDIRLDPDWSDK